MFVSVGLRKKLEIVNVIRTPFQDGKPGIVKIQFENKDKKIEELKATTQLVTAQ